MHILENSFKLCIFNFYLKYDMYSEKMICQCEISKICVQIL